MSDSWARFDDAIAGTARVFDAPERVIRADRVADVAPALAQVQRAADDGAWAVGFLAYEAAPGLDPSLQTAQSDPRTPLLWFGICAPPRIEAAVSGAQRRPSPAQWSREWTPQSYGRDVEAVCAQIAAGEVYQCNLTTGLTGDVVDPSALYASMASAQQGAYAAYLDIGSQAILSASPELFIEWSGADLLTRPMKGTVRRGRTTVEDHAAAQALRASEKDRAENVMIVDLLRNDLAKVCELASVSVPELCELERFAGVWQLVSAVRGRLRTGVGLPEIFAALFPCGSVTGAPKERSMRIIADIERRPRGVYCGSIGWLAPPTEPVRARFSVAIRTAVVDVASGRARYGTGSGITWSSTPEVELAELTDKTRVLTSDLQAVTLLETMLGSPEGTIRNLDRHLARLADSAGYFGIPVDLDAVRNELVRAVIRDAPARIRLTVDPRGVVRAVAVALAPTRPGLVRLAIDDEPIDSRSPRLCHKITARAVYDMRAARHPGADDVVLVNEHGLITETTIANIAVLRAGCWVTPPVSDGCLPGVERGRLLDTGALAVGQVDIAELRAADQIATVSSLRGWRAAALTRTAE